MRDDLCVKSGRSGYDGQASRSIQDTEWSRPTCGEAEKAVCKSISEVGKKKLMTINEDHRSPPLSYPMIPHHLVMSRCIGASVQR